MKKEFRDILKAKGRTALPKVLLVSAECMPLSKTGGLADVVGTLPKSLAELGVDARVITPYHRCIKDKYADQVVHMVDFFTWLGWRHAYVGIEMLVVDGVTIYLVDNEQYFGEKIYRSGYFEEGEQYAFFTRAVLDAIPVLDFVPDIIHCNDWHTAMLPMLAKTQYKGGMQADLKSLLTIHNIAFQGKYGLDFVQDLLHVDARYYTPDGIESFGCANFLKAGCVYSDRINTVSPSYAEEIKTPYYGEGLDGILNARAADLSGIVNGIDKDVFNPNGDPLIPAKFSHGRLKGKAACKKALQEKMGLEQRADVPLFAMVTRMTEQKGFDLVAAILDDLMANTDMQFVLLGTGEWRFENLMREAEQRWKGRLSAYIGYNEELAHLVYAGSDFYLMPSRFEPCGLSQMIAMRYGSLPIVRATGGLRDTVSPYKADSGEGTGFLFDSYDAGALNASVHEALACWANKEQMTRMINNAMAADFGFAKSAMEYVRLYLSLL